MFKFLGNLFKPAAEAYKARQSRKREELATKLEHDSETMKTNAELVRHGREKDAKWELAAWKNSGWKDEMWSVLLAIVFLGSFVPGLQNYVQTGIDQITGYPQWFQFLFMSIVLASHGIRLWRRWT